MSTPPPNPFYKVPISVLMEGGSVEVIQVPRMSPTAFNFFKEQLDKFTEAIVIDDPPTCVPTPDTPQ